MKKIIIPFLVLTFLTGCKNSEKQTDNETLKDSTSADSKKSADAACTVYQSSGNVITKVKADLFICLPKIINSNNLYSIAEVYDVSGSGVNKLVIHLKDDLGQDLRNTSNDLDQIKFTIDLSKLKGIDPAKEIKTVIYHDNSISDNDMAAKAKQVYATAQSNRNCNPSLATISKTEKKVDEILIPKVCGTGTIKPLEISATE